MAAWYRAVTPMLDWRERLVLPLREPAGRDGGERDQAAPVTSYALGRGGGSSITSGG
jgi:hypothetical protein